MKVGDLVKLRMQVKNGQHSGPSIGIIYEIDTSSGHDANVIKCLWDVPRWNCIQWRELELVVVSG